MSYSSSIFQHFLSRGTSKPTLIYAAHLNHLLNSRGTLKLLCWLKNIRIICFNLFFTQTKFSLRQKNGKKIEANSLSNARKILLKKNLLFIKIYIPYLSPPGKKLKLLQYFLDTRYKTKYLNIISSKGRY